MGMGSNQPQHYAIVYTVLVSMIDMDYVIVWPTGHRKTKLVLFEVILNMTVSMDGLRWLLYIRKVMINHHKSDIFVLWTNHLFYHIKWRNGRPRMPGGARPWSRQPRQPGSVACPILHHWDLDPAESVAKVGPTAARGCSDWDWGGKQASKTPTKMGCSSGPVGKYVGFFSHVFCCNSTSLVAGWLAEIELYVQWSKDAMKGFNYDPPSLLKTCDLLCVAIGGLV